ncbi:MAG: ABC transporter ATP-binding protein [Acidobacteria bacterium]|nr:ABC transporter ATP-binding protein [Acidobacteriota bacterium]
MPREGTAVEVKQLRKSFGAQRVLSGINLKVAYGETLTVLGRSGTGKSVLLKLIVGLQTPDSGSVTIDGQDIAGLSPRDLNEVRKAIGFLFQHAALYDSLSVEDNVGFPLQRHTSMSASERKERVAQLLRQVGMEEHGRKMPAQISGGMQKRVALARALALEPRILLFDEPTTGLDPITASGIDELILQVQKRQGNASIVVTHDLHSARTISDRLILVLEGQAVAEGSYDELKQSQDEFVSRFMAQAA